MFYKTALHIAVQNDNSDIVKLLLTSAKNIDRNIKDEIFFLFFFQIKFQLGFLMVFKINLWKTPVKYAKDKTIVHLLDH